MQTTKNSIIEYADELTSDSIRELKNICNEFEKVSSMIIDMASHCSERQIS